MRLCRLASPCESMCEVSVRPSRGTPDPVLAVYNGGAQAATFPPLVPEI